MKSQLVSTNGHALEVPQPENSWRAPTSGAFFGWLGQDGFTTIRLDDIQAVCPNPQYTGRSMVVMRSGLQVVINASDCERLMKRMGWKEPETAKDYRHGEART